MTGLLLLLLVAQPGCSALSRKLRENERIFALEAAQSRIQHGQCSSALKFLDRSQARLELGEYARASTLARIRCYQRMGLSRLANSHLRLLGDFYTTEPMAFPKADGSSVFRLTDLAPDDYQTHPSWLKIPQPHYSLNASRSRIIGRVIVAFQISNSTGPENIRVLEMPHPLLATWAIEAVAQGEIRSGFKPDLTTGHHYIATFSFESRWAHPIAAAKL
ncbi:MAG: energy transducer TonB [Myxococcota bacterium]